MVLLLALSQIGYGQDRMTGKSFVTRSEVIAQNAMAATSHPLATQIALEVMKAGGNAIDAAIAANAAIGLMEPTGNGMGGDLFAIIWDAKTQKLHGLNASGRSPKSLSLDYFKEQGLKSIPSYGPIPVSVPGAVDGWWEMHQKFGTAPWASLFDPAIHYARAGFPIPEYIAFYWQRGIDILGKYPNFMETFSIDGRKPEVGDVKTNPALANTFEKIAQGGRDAFYKGDIARTIDAFMKKQGGFLSYEDMASHSSEWIDPVSINYRGYEVWELPPNGQGIVALQMLNILEGYDFSKIPFGSAEHIHLFTEAKKLAFEDRAKYYADMDYYEAPIDWLISKEYAAQRRALIDPNRAARSVDAGNPALREGDTIYMTVADAEGNMVSLIQSNYRGMGSGMVPDGLGFVLQNRGELFDLNEGQANTYAPGKRPFQTIIPAFMTKDGQPFLSFGVMGGAFQPLGHTQIVMNIVDFGMNIQEAGDAPRIDHAGSSEPTGEKMQGPGYLLLEEGFGWEVIRALQNKGHSIRWGSGGYGGYQGIRYDPVRKIYFGASESRKDGQAAGY
jgi:gamma-glutamyltranspeptidase/glutathione hydrolase